MSVEDIITAVTLTPAAAVGLHNIVSNISEDEADTETLDLTILEVRDVENAEAVDCHDQTRCLNKIFVPRYVVRKGELKIIGC